MTAHVLFVRCLVTSTIAVNERPHFTRAINALVRRLRLQRLGPSNARVPSHEGTLDITRDMTRQYKGMQEELLNRINQLEGTIQVNI